MKPLKSLSEQRSFPRYQASIPAGVYLKKNPHVVFDAEILDISQGGAFVHCVAPIQLGEEILVEVRFGETRLFDGKVIPHEDLPVSPSRDPERSIVKWVRGSTQSGFGVEFVSLGKDKKEFLTKLVQYFQRLNKAGVSFPK